jgi:hypothetical protein
MEVNGQFHVALALERAPSTLGYEARWGPEGYECCGEENILLNPVPRSSSQ